MEKNENGYPMPRRTDDAGKSRDAAPMPNGKTGSGDASDNVMRGGMTNGQMQGNGVGGSENRMTEMRERNCPTVEQGSIDSKPLAYVYAPSQRFCMLYSAKDALDHGTLFEALYKPMEVYGRE